MNGRRTRDSRTRSKAYTDENMAPNKLTFQTADRDDVSIWLSEKIKKFVLENPDNTLGVAGDGHIFDGPLIGFASGADPIFSKFREIIGPYHLMPHETLDAVAKQKCAPSPSAEEVGVISYVLPIAQAIRKENASMSSAPSRRWAYTRLYGEEFNKALQRYIVSILVEEGYLAIAPEASDLFKTTVDGMIGPASNWSQRHVAFAAGLGTFGLSDGLITSAGMAHRLGSVVVNVPFESPRRSDDIHRDCIYFQTGACMACVKRCPVGAISKDGHDKMRCREFVFSQDEYIRKNYNLDIYGCGLCQTGVPCENKAPSVRRPD